MLYVSLWGGPLGSWRYRKTLLLPLKYTGLRRCVQSELSHSSSNLCSDTIPGNGFGWWPAFIYDPRYTIGSARNLARKNLGKRHLVYFFECHEAPFAVLTSAKLTKCVWKSSDREVSLCAGVFFAEHSTH